MQTDIVTREQVREADRKFENQKKRDRRWAIALLIATFVWVFVGLVALVLFSSKIDPNSWGQTLGMTAIIAIFVLVAFALAGVSGSLSAGPNRIDFHPTEQDLRNYEDDRRVEVLAQEIEHKVGALRVLLLLQKLSLWRRF